MTEGWYPPPDPEDGRLDFPATHRNRDALWEVLDRWLPERGRILEIASGSGQHVVHFAQRLAASQDRSALRFVPSDPDPEHRRSIRAWIEHAELTERIEAPLDVDTCADDWGIDAVAGILCFNMIHIAPWSACLGLLDGGARRLEPGASLCLYGPFMRGGAHTSESNAQFDARLKSRDPAWGVRDLDDVATEASRVGLELVEVVQMPANNFSVRFDRR